MPPLRLPADWPHRDWSRSLRVGALDWHVQVAGRGPVVLWLHGSGASAHSWAEVLPELTDVCTVVAPDLPGHGFTLGAGMDMLTLPRIAAELRTLIQALGVAAPTLIVGHSAGAALGLRLALDAPPPRGVLGFNPSLVAPSEVYTRLMAPLLNPLATSAPMAWLLSAIAPGTGMIERLLNSTGSDVPAAQRARYRLLFGRADHVRGALGFMAAADLPALIKAGPTLKTPPTFVLGTRDAWVPEAPLSAAIARGFPQATVHRWPGGHLLHEEMPGDAAALVRQRLVAG